MNEDATTNKWLEAIVEETDAKAKEIETLIGCIVEPFVFVVEEGKDAAVGFFKKPDAKQCFKLLRTMGDDYESGIEMIARAQLIRSSDMIARGVEGEASDPRFMDANGVYDMQNAELNFNLMKRAASLITLFVDMFKKKQTVT